MGQFVLYLEGGNPHSEQIEVTIKLPPKVEEYLNSQNMERVEVNHKSFVPEIEPQG